MEHGPLVEIQTDRHAECRQLRQLGNDRSIVRCISLCQTHHSETP
jgi:hypothetical protein